MSFASEPWPEDGFSDVFRVCLSKSKEEINVERFLQESRHNSRYLFAVQTLNPTTLRKVREEGLIPPWLEAEDLMRL